MVVVVFGSLVVVKVVVVTAARGCIEVDLMNVRLAGPPKIGAFLSIFSLKLYEPGDSSVLRLYLEK